MHVLKRVENERMRRREEVRSEVRKRLRQALATLAPGEQVMVFGSITRPQAFHDRSDVDIAFVDEPRAFSRYQMQARLEEFVERPVDLVTLNSFWQNNLYHKRRPFFH
ncbi:MAG TPA: nucleotidyltransferase domain-containing protein [Acidobacteriota bacterium]|jgi:predicted nucleotidyltransferase|nr:nucleotidyltransferase domain-containing protein [Acidobacteriota bacterium]